MKAGLRARLPVWTPKMGPDWAVISSRPCRPRRRICVRIAYAALMARLCGASWQILAKQLKDAETRLEKARKIQDKQQRR